MGFKSILFKENDDQIKSESLNMPEFFTDLNLDQIVHAVTHGKEGYNLKPFFYTPLNNVDAILYRQETARNLENKELKKAVESFSRKMILMRRYLSLIEKLSSGFHKQGWFLESVIVYCDAVKCLSRDMSGIVLKSTGLIAFRNYINSYVDSENFTTLVFETQKIKHDLSDIKYCVIIKGSRVTVCRYQQETDYSIEVEKTFKKFKQGAVKSHLSDISIASGMNHVEEKILEIVVKLYPDVFFCLDNYCRNNKKFYDNTINRFDREIQFYLSYIDYISGLRQSGLKFCYPAINSTKKKIHDYEGFDLALAKKLLSEKKMVVCNDFYLKDKERILIVSGPNQGGKTTFARTFGQLHYLACLGLPVPGIKAQLFLFSSIFTHFEREENIRNLRGKLQDDLIRIHSILKKATPESIILMNEIFTSTSLQDAIFLSRKVMETITELDALCVWVTFIDELACFNEKTVSMVSTVVPENPAVRTFKILRKPADGLAYAITIAEKYQVTYTRLKERIKP